MDMTKGTIVLLVLASVCGVACAEQADPCDSVLVNQFVSTSATSNSLYAWLKLIDSTTYDEARHSAKGQAYENLFSGSYDDFTKKMSAYRSTDAGIATHSDAREAFKSYLSPEQVSAWRDCKLGHLELIASYDKIDESGAILTLIWSPPGDLSGAIGPLKITQVNFARGTAPQDLRSLKEVNGSVSFVLTRPSSGAAIRGAITGVTERNNKSYAAGVYIPAVIKIVAVPEPQRGYQDKKGEVVTSFAYWNNGAANKSFDCIAPQSGKVLIVASTTDVNRGMNRQGHSKGPPGCVPWAQHWCQTLGEFCIDRHIQEGCLVNDVWDRWWKDKLEKSGLPYSKAAACEAAAR